MTRLLTSLRTQPFSTVKRKSEKNQLVQQLRRKNVRTVETIDLGEHFHPLDRPKDRPILPNY